ncbi:MAG: hypothetical protein ABI741_09190 [Ferruginibacter sp.]
MQASQRSTSRKKFLLWTATVLSSFTALKFLTPAKEKKEGKTDTVKMLTQDGKLVAIDKDIIIRSARKISDKELQQWIKNNSSTTLKNITNEL